MALSNFDMRLLRTLSTTMQCFIPNRRVGFCRLQKVCEVGLITCRYTLDDKFVEVNFWPLLQLGSSTNRDSARKQK